MHVMDKNSDSGVPAEDNGYQLKPVPEIELSAVEIENLEAKNVIWMRKFSRQDLRSCGLTSESVVSAVISNYQFSAGW